MNWSEFFEAGVKRGKRRAIMPSEYKLNFALVTIGSGFVSHWLRKWRKFCQPITERSKAKPKQTLNYFRHSIENSFIQVFT